MIYGNYINESYSFSLDSILGESTYIVDLYDKDLLVTESIGITIINKILNAITTLIEKFKLFIRRTIDAVKVKYMQTTKVFASGNLKEEVELSDYPSFSNFDNDINSVIQKAEDSERKLEMNRNNTDFHDSIRNSIDDIRSYKFEEDKIFVKKKYNKTSDIREISRMITTVYKQIIASKQNILKKISSIEVMTKNAKRNLTKDENAFNNAGNQIASSFYSALLTFLHRVVKIHYKIDTNIMRDMNKIVSLSVKNKVDNTVEFAKLVKSWAATIAKFPKLKKEEYEIKSEEQYQLITKLHNNIYTTEDYDLYKESFRKIAELIGKPAREIIIQNMEITPNKKFGILKIRYAQGLSKVSLPPGTHLIHSSPVELPGYVQGQFRSRVNGKYFYPERRAFFTVARTVDPGKNGTTGMKSGVYVTKDTYTTAYLDPSCPKFSERCVMLCTDEKIPVEKQGSIKTESFQLEDSVEEVIEGGINLDDFLEDIHESFSELEYINEDNAFHIMMKTIHKWHTSTKKQRIKKYYNNSISDEEYDMLKEYITSMKSADKYDDYKKPFVKFCKFCSILPEHVIITKYKLKKKEDHNSLYVEYSNNNKKIQLPEGINLYHISKVPNIKALRPAFQGKSERGYLYDKPRIYFTLYKKMPKFLADYSMTDKLYKYKCNKNIRSVYVDPLVWLFAYGAVYIETNVEVPVTPANMEETNH